MRETRDAYVQKLKAKMDEWNAKIDKLTAKADQAKAESKMKYHKQLEDLHSKRKNLENKIAEMESAGAPAWEDLKQGIENSWDILKKSFARAKSEFERGYGEGREES